MISEYFSFKLIAILHYKFRQIFRDMSILKTHIVFYDAFFRICISCLDVKLVFQMHICHTFLFAFLHQVNLIFTQPQDKANIFTYKQIYKCVSEHYDNLNGMNGSIGLGKDNISSNLLFVHCQHCQATIVIMNLYLLQFE